MSVAAGATAAGHSSPSIPFPRLGALVTPVAVALAVALAGLVVAALLMDETPPSTDSPQWDARF